MKKIKLNDELEVLVEMLPQEWNFTNDSEKYVCAYMYYFATADTNENGEFKMPITALTNALKIHRNTASVYVASLIKKGYFEILKKGDNLTHTATTYKCLDKSICALSISSNISISRNSNNNLNRNSNVNTTIVLENSIEENNKKENNIKEKETTMTTDELEAIRIARTANFNNRKNQTTKVVNNNFNFNFEDVATKVTGNNSTLKYDTFIQWLQERLEKLDALEQWEKSSYFNSIINFVFKWYPKVEDPKFSQELMIKFLKQHFNEMNGNMFTTEPSTSYGKRVMAQ